MFRSCSCSWVVQSRMFYMSSQIVHGEGGVRWKATRRKLRWMCFDPSYQAIFAVSDEYSAAWAKVWSTVREGCECENHFHMM